MNHNDKSSPYPLYTLALPGLPPNQREPNKKRNTLLGKTYVLNTIVYPDEKVVSTTERRHSHILLLIKQFNIFYWRLKKLSPALTNVWVNVQPNLWEGWNGARASEQSRRRFHSQAFFEIFQLLNVFFSYKHFHRVQLDRHPHCNHSEESYLYTLFSRPDF